MDDFILFFLNCNRRTAAIQWNTVTSCNNSFRQLCVCCMLQILLLIIFVLSTTCSVHTIYEWICATLLFIPFHFLQWHLSINAAPSRASEKRQFSKAHHMNKTKTINFNLNNIDSSNSCCLTQHKTDKWPQRCYDMPIFRMQWLLFGRCVV